MEIKIPIPQEASDYVQMLFLRYTSITNLLKYLTTQKSTLPEWIEYYNKQYEDSYNELELAKTEITVMYCPAGLVNYDYTFDFEKSEIIFVNKDI